MKPARLAGHGVDIVEKALRPARERIDQAGLEMRLVQGDVTALRNAGVGTGLRLLLDTPEPPKPD